MRKQTHRAGSLGKLISNQPGKGGCGDNPGFKANSREEYFLQKHQLQRIAQGGAATQAAVVDSDSKERGSDFVG